jgi:anti-anti-sigma regulatory factor
MEHCPLCESFGIVEMNKPCYWCGLSLVEIANGKTIAIVPGWMMFDGTARPARVLQRLRTVAGGMVLDFSEVESLDSDGIAAIVPLLSAAKLCKLELVFAQVGPDLMEVLRLYRLHKAFRIVDDVDAALEAFGSD